MKKKKIIILSLIAVVLVIIGVFLVLFFNRKFDVTFKDLGSLNVVKVKYNHQIPDSKNYVKENMQWYEVTYDKDDKEVLSKKPFDFDSKIKRKVELKAVYDDIAEDEIVTVSFDTDGGTKVDSIDYKKGSKLTLPNEPTKKGFTFVRWEDENTKEVKDEQIVENDMVLKAIWKKQETEKVTVTFDSDGGSKVSNITLKRGGKLTLPQNPTKNGYTFVRWEDKNKKAFANGTIVNGNITLKAVWNKVEEKPAPAEKVTVTFNTDGGSKVNNITLDKGSKLTLPVNPTKEGYKFLRWEDANSKAFASGTIINANITLKAIWEKQKVVTYSCPAGYKLSDTKCIRKTRAQTRCPEKTKAYDGKCLLVNEVDKKAVVRECGTKMINYGNGHVEETKGELFQLGASFCYYGVVTTRRTEDECLQGHIYVWNNTNNKCYYAKDGANENVIFTCSDSNRVYIGDPFEQFNVPISGGCFLVKNKEYYCIRGTLNGISCDHSINATKTES